MKPIKYAAFSDLTARCAGVDDVSSRCCDRHGNLGPKWPQHHGFSCIAPTKIEKNQGNKMELWEFDPGNTFFWHVFGLL